MNKIWRKKLEMLIKSEVKNKRPVASDLVKKTDYDTKILEIEGKYITTSDFIINLRVTYLMQRQNKKN